MVEFFNRYPEEESKGDGEDDDANEVIGRAPVAYGGDEEREHAGKREAAGNHLIANEEIACEDAHGSKNHQDNENVSVVALHRVFKLLPASILEVAITYGNDFSDRHRFAVVAIVRPLASLGHALVLIIGNVDNLLVWTEIVVLRALVSERESVIEEEVKHNHNADND